MRSIKVFIFVFWIGLSGLNTTFAEQELGLLLRDNSLLKVTTTTDTLRWKSVIANGEISEIQIPLADVRSLKLVKNSANSEAAAILRNLSLLESNDYHERQAAEKALSDREMFSKYRAVIQNRLEKMKSYDARYRVERMLRKYSTSQETKQPEFDRLVLKNGKILNGDCTQAQLEFVVYGQKRSLGRSHIDSIFSWSENQTPQFAPREKVLSQPYLRFESDFAKQIRGGANRLDFSRNSEGNPFASRTSIEKEFSNQGLLFLAPNEYPGFVGITEFSLNSVTSAPSDGNSAAVHLDRGRIRQFRGQMEIRFCEPGNPARSAAINRFGLSLAKCNHFRDFVLEAYNRDNQILATAEATSRPGVFLGVESNEPITRIEIKTNPYLKNSPSLMPDERVPDDNFAIDDVCFSTPFPYSQTGGQLLLAGRHHRNGRQH